MESGEGRWFEAEIRPHEPHLRAWLRRRFPASLDVDDLVQESYLRLLRTARPTGLRSPKAFLFAVARNLALDQLRRRQATGETALTGDVPEVTTEEAGPSREAERGRELELLREAIGQLPERCREIFVLRKVHRLGQAEIAARLGISEHTVSAQLTIGFHKCAAYVLERAAWRKAES